MQEKFRKTSCFARRFEMSFQNPGKKAQIAAIVGMNYPDAESQLKQSEGADFPYVVLKGLLVV